MKKCPCLVSYLANVKNVTQKQVGHGVNILLMKANCLWNFDCCLPMVVDQRCFALDQVTLNLPKPVDQLN